MIGTLGPIVFGASSNFIQTFKDFSSSNSARIATHENLQNKPIIEFIGPGLDSISLKLTWSIEGNINPKVEVKKLEDYRDMGKVVTFFLAGAPVGTGKYLIESINRDNKRIDNRGNIHSISFDIKLIEYIEDANIGKKILSNLRKEDNNRNLIEKKNIKKKKTYEKVYK